MSAHGRGDLLARAGQQLLLAVIGETVASHVPRVVADRQQHAQVLARGEQVQRVAQQGRCELVGPGRDAVAAFVLVVFGHARLSRVIQAFAMVPHRRQAH